MRPITKHMQPMSPLLNTVWRQHFVHLHELSFYMVSNIRLLSFLLLTRDGSGVQVVAVAGFHISTVSSWLLALPTLVFFPPEHGGKICLYDCGMRIRIHISIGLQLNLNLDFRGQNLNDKKFEKKWYGKFRNIKKQLHNSFSGQKCSTSSLQ